MILNLTIKKNIHNPNKKNIQIQEIIIYHSEKLIFLIKLKKRIKVLIKKKMIFYFKIDCKSIKNYTTFNHLNNFIISHEYNFIKVKN